MPTLPASGASFTVETNGQALSVAAGTSASSLVQTLYSDAACTSSVTTPHTITSDTTYYLPLDVANVAHYISCKQPDGTELWGKKQHVGGITIAPLPTAAQVGADVSPIPNGILASGNYYFTIAASVTSTISNALNTLVCHQFYVPNAITITKIGAELTTQGSAGAVLRLGVWSDSSGAPGTLLSDAGTLVGDASTGSKEITLGTPLALAKGMYWFGGCPQVATSTWRSATTSSTFPYNFNLGTTIPGAGTAPACHYQSSVTGAFGASFTSGGVSGPGSVYRIFIKTA